MTGRDPAFALRVEPQEGLAAPRINPAQGLHYNIKPITGRAALAWIAQTHRHLPKLQGALFAASVHLNDDCVGVAVAGNPARVWQGTGRIVITRVAVLPGLRGQIDGNGVEHAAPACTMLYRALCDASKALGYREVWTYTLPEEPGNSLRAAGFACMGQSAGGDWGRKSRPRAPAVRADPKLRWMRHFGNPVTTLKAAA